LEGAGAPATASLACARRVRSPGRRRGRRSLAPRRTIRRCGGEQALKWLVRKEATLRLTQICVRGLPPDPEIGEFANRAGGLETLEAERSSNTRGDLSTINHDINLPA
jgi:hypothetical protein